MAWKPQDALALGQHLIEEVIVPPGTELTVTASSDPDRLQFNARRGQQGGAVGVSSEALADQGESSAGFALNELLDMITSERLPDAPNSDAPLLALLTSGGWERD